MSDGVPAGAVAGGAIYLIIMSKTLAGSCAVVTSVMWLVALRYGNFQRNSQRLFQDALADTGQAPFPFPLLTHPAPHTGLVAPTATAAAASRPNLAVR